MVIIRILEGIDVVTLKIIRRYRDMVIFWILGGIKS